MNYSSILINWILFAVIYCKTVQFATVNLNYSNLLVTVLPDSYCKNPLKCLTVVWKKCFTNSPLFLIFLH